MSDNPDRKPSGEEPRTRPQTPGRLRIPNIFSNKDNKAPPSPALPQQYAVPVRVDPTERYYGKSSYTTDDCPVTPKKSSPRVLQQSPNSTPPLGYPVTTPTKQGEKKHEDRLRNWVAATQKREQERVAKPSTASSDDQELQLEREIAHASPTPSTGVTEHFLGEPSFQKNRPERDLSEYSSSSTAKPDALQRPALSRSELSSASTAKTDNNLPFGAAQAAKSDRHRPTMETPAEPVSATQRSTPSSPSKGYLPSFKNLSMHDQKKTDQKSKHQVHDSISDPLGIHRTLEKVEQGHPLDPPSFPKSSAKVPYYDAYGTPSAPMQQSKAVENVLRRSQHLIPGPFAPKPLPSISRKPVEKPAVDYSSPAAYGRESQSTYNASPTKQTAADSSLKTGKSSTAASDLEGSGEATASPKKKKTTQATPPLPVGNPFTSTDPSYDPFPLPPREPVDLTAIPSAVPSDIPIPAPLSCGPARVDFTSKEWLALTAFLHSNTPINHDWPEALLSIRLPTLTTALRTQQTAINANIRAIKVCLPVRKELRSRAGPAHPDWATWHRLEAEQDKERLAQAEQGLVRNLHETQIRRMANDYGVRRCLRTGMVEEKRSAEFRDKLEEEVRGLRAWCRASCE